MNKDKLNENSKEEVKSISEELVFWIKKMELNLMEE